MKPETPYRAVRGWCLGSQLPMRIRNAMKEEGPDCECTYSRPFLHSLVLTHCHWDSPVMRNEPGECRRLSVPAHSIRRWDAWATGSSYVRQCCVGGCGDCVPPAHMYEDPDRVTSGSPHGGYYSYLPAHIERMGNWEHVHVLGIVSCFGDLVIHERGYRSDIIRIDRLWVVRSENVRFSPARLQSFLERTYDCPVTLLKRTAGFTDWVKGENIEELCELPE